MSETRERIADRVRTEPGIHFNELVRTLDLAPGQVQYHVRRLLGDERLVSEAVNGRTHYFPPEFDPEERHALAVVRRETALDALSRLVARGPTRPGTLADDLGIARSTLEWHLDGLVASGLVEKRRDERGRVTLALADPERVGRLLSTVEPTVPERLVDRFTRLVDGLLEGE